VTVCFLIGVASACHGCGLGVALLRVARPSGGGPVGARVGSSAARHGPDLVLVACQGVTPHAAHLHLRRRGNFRRENVGGH
jgi:hypothetical protein